jgi:hypothetical protein
MRAMIALGAVMIMGAGGARAEESGTGAMVSSGRLLVWGAAQFLYQQVQADPGRGVNGVQRFQTRHFQVGLVGEPSEKAAYAITVDAVQGNTLQAGIYEAWIQFRPSPNWTVQMGSFFPPWTLTMAEPIHDLRFIRYPLLVDSGQMLFTPWRQTGIMASAHPGGKLMVAVGIFAGLDVPWRFQDDNNMTDTMVSARFEVSPGIRLYVGHWGGKTQLTKVLVAPGESAALPFGMSRTNSGATPVYAGGGLVEHTNTWVGFELDRWNVYAAAEALWNQSTRNGSGLRNAQGYQVSLGYRLLRLMPLLRYEQFDPNADNANTGADDGLEWTTVGVNFDLTSRARLMADYIFKSEHNDNQRANDEFLVQVSLGY